MQLPKNILIVFGTRPEAIKMAPVVLMMKRYPRLFNLTVCSTGQHRELLDDVLKLFKIVPEHELRVMKGDQDLFYLTAEISQKMKDLLAQAAPDLVLVQGDTTTSFVAALGAFYHKTLIGHVEAGLRTGDKNVPWPEEVNRRMISCMADVHFVPTAAARENLIKENVPAQRIFLTGNTVVDALKFADRTIESDAALRASLDAHFAYLNPAKRLVLLTCHRRESFGRSVEGILTAVRFICDENEDIELLYPVHPNPRVHEPAFRILKGEESRAKSRIHVVAPLDYLSLVYLLKRSCLVLTDSGGIVEEAPSFGKPVLVLREKTERQEAIAAGAATLIGTSPDEIIDATRAFLRGGPADREAVCAVNPFGDGLASVRIINGICGLFGMPEPEDVHPWEAV